MLSYYCALWQVWCLDSQIRHKVHLLKDHLLGSGKPPVVVLAHSIGSYMMLQAMKQLEEEAQAAGPEQVSLLQQQLPKVGVCCATVCCAPFSSCYSLHTTVFRCRHSKQHSVIRLDQFKSLHTYCCTHLLFGHLMQVVLLTPFLATDWSSRRQRTLQLAARMAPVLAAAAGAVGRLPMWLQDRLLPLVQPGAEPHSCDSLKGLMSYNSAYNNFHLAHHEFRWGQLLLCSGVTSDKQVTARRTTAAPFVCVIFMICIVCMIASPCLLTV